MRLAILGTGNVAQTLARGWSKAGHEVSPPLEVGEPVATRTEPPPALDEAAQAAFIARSQALAPQYRTELLRP